MTVQEIFLISLLFRSISALHIPSEAARSVGLLPRADPVCGGNTALSQCGRDFPSEFCCQAGSTCFGFNNDQSVICCPEKECGFINMLSCEPAVYNATAYPDSPIHMKDLSASAYIPCSGSNLCCPKGYLCSGGGCKLDASKQVATSSGNPGAAPTTTSRGALPTTILSLSSAPPQTSTSINNPTASASTSATPNPASATNSPIPSPSSQYPWPAILIGLIPGLVVGCLLAFLFIICLGRRKARKLTSDSSSSLGPTAAKISDPIYSVDPTATRTDFLRHASRRIVRKVSQPLLNSKPSNLSETLSRNSSNSRMRSIFRRTPSARQNNNGNNKDIDPWSTPSPTNHHHHHNNNNNNADFTVSAAERALDERLNRMNTTSNRSDNPQSNHRSDDPRTPRRREPSMESIPIYNNTPDAGGYQRNTAFADLLPAVSMRSASDPVGNGGGGGQRSPTRGGDGRGGLVPPIYFGGEPLAVGKGRRIL